MVRTWFVGGRGRESFGGKEVFQGKVFFLCKGAPFTW